MSDIAEWLGSLGLRKYADAFATNAIDFDVLAELSDADLRDIGIAAVGDRKRLLSAIAALGTKSQVDQLASPERPTADKREVVVLFADIVGYTALTQRFDTEELHSVLDRYFRLADNILKAHGGHIDKHIGDSVMAVFGAPLASGNDAERALLAAIRLRDQAHSIELPDRSPLCVHIGMASGSVLASRTGSEYFEEYTVTGDAVNLAARLVAVAQAGEIVVSDRLRRELGDMLTTEAMGGIALRGIAEDQQVHKVLGVKAGRGRSDRPIVGRQAELDQFDRGLTRTIRDRRGMVVLVRGEAGIGKTRLTQEFLRKAADLGCRSLHVAVLDFGASDGREPIIKLARALVGMDQSTDEPTADFESILRDCSPEPELRPHVYDLLGLPQPENLAAVFAAMDNDTRVRGRRAVFRNLVGAAASSQAICLAIEDIHWATRSFVELLAVVASAAVRLPLAVVLTTRPESDPLDHAWRTQSAGITLTTLDLAALQDEDAQALAAGFTGVSAKTVERCIARAGGHPLFLEQLLLHASDGADEEVPGSVASLVLSRLDRLSPRDKRAAQAAAVLGQRFSLEVLRHTLGHSSYDCTPLLDAHIVGRDGEDLRFVHALVRDGAYASLLRAARVALHLQATDWYESRDTVLWAAHLEQADDARAGDALLSAARGLFSSYQAGRALPLVERALARGGLAEEFSAHQLKTTLLRELGRITDADAAAGTAISIAKSADQRCDALHDRANVARLAGRFDDALRHLDEAEAEVGSDKARLAAIWYMRGNILFPLARAEECRAAHQRALELAVEIGSTEAEARAHSGLGDAFYMAGRFRTGGRHFRRAVEIARAHGYTRVEVSNLFMIALVALHDEPADQALLLADKAISAARAIGDLRAEGWAWSVRSGLLHRVGDWVLLKKAGEEFRRCGISAGSPLIEMNGLSVVARAAGLEGDEAGGLPMLREVLAFARKSAMRFFGPIVLGAIARFTKDPGEAEAAIVEAEAALSLGCVSHAHLFYREDLIQKYLASEDWDGVERNAAALEEFARAEPFTFSQTVSAYGHALVRFGRGYRGDELAGQLRALRRTIAELGWVSYLGPLDAAIAEFGKKLEGLQ
jgi:class 3 adenylate cyclase/tetratricopeptide (TPR) repeat protein